MVEDNDGKDETILFSNSMVEENKKKNWFLDFDHSNHMCNDKNMFANLMSLSNLLLILTTMKGFLWLKKEKLVLL